MSLVPNKRHAGDVNPHSHGHPYHRQSHSHDRGSVISDHGAMSKHRGKYKPTDFDMDKLRSTLKQFVRDWSEEVH